MCEEWRTSFEAFRDWAMTSGYAEHLSIDRIANDGNYEPENCRWATLKEQQRNTRSNRILTYEGQSMTMVEWAEELGIKYVTLKTRLNKLGWSVEKSLTHPVGR
jgi:undecaprenyl pyrophosphate synthase